MVDYRVLTDPSGKPIDPHGFSGGLVWNTNRAVRGGTWTPDDAKVIGVAVKYIEEEEVIAFVRVEIVREFIIGYLRRKSAYYHWLDMGRPKGTALRDWLLAETKLPRLENDI